VITLKPVSITSPSSLPAPLAYAVGSTLPPTKDRPESWWSQAAWQRYLGGGTADSAADFANDSDFSDPEHAIGIGIDSGTGTQNGEQFYSAHSLRLREGWRLGTLAEAQDKVNGNADDRRDLIAALFPNNGSEAAVIVGGQQRICSVQRQNPVELPLPRSATISGTRVKWVLLTPAVFPRINDHPGAWLPSWVDMTGAVQLLDGPGKNYAKRHPKVPVGRPILAQLVASIIGKPAPVTGYALPNAADPDRSQGGAKATHLAVPAGAVYYFECADEPAALALAAALNWHGTTPGTQIRNRRSTLMGEKGFGLGVCGTWDFHHPPA
jgi:CRISPR type III-B/RAMP module-associated protein Cmr3